MKTDTYTKVILTVIACSLSIIAGKGVGLFPAANAYGHDIQKVEITNVLPLPVYIDGPVEVWGEVRTQ